LTLNLPGTWLTRASQVLRRSASACSDRTRVEHRVGGGIRADSAHRLRVVFGAHHSDGAVRS